MVGKGKFALVDIARLHRGKIDGRWLGYKHRRGYIGFIGNLEDDLVLILDGGFYHLPFHRHQIVVEKDRFIGSHSGFDPNPPGLLLVIGSAHSITVSPGRKPGEVHFSQIVGGGAFLDRGDGFVLDGYGSAFEPLHDSAVGAHRSRVDVGDLEDDLARS